MMTGSLEPNPMNRVEVCGQLIVKTELTRDARKRNSLAEEAAIIADLNQRNCPCVPRLLDFGTNEHGQNYLVLLRIESAGPASSSDLWLSYLAARGCGWEHGDLKQSNVIFDGQIAWLIDFDQAFPSSSSLAWEKGFVEPALRPHFKSLSRKPLDLSQTALARQGTSTKGSNGIYHSISEEHFHLKGERGLGDREKILRSIDFAGEACLDLGCNTGAVTRFLAGEGGAASVVGVEHCKPHAVLGQMVNCALGVRNARILTGSIGRDPLPTGDFDTALLFSVFHHLPDPSACAAAIGGRVRRVLLEVRLAESGCSNAGQGNAWRSTGGWNFKSWPDLIGYLESMFAGFRFSQDCGAVDRSRRVLEFLR